MRPRPTPPPHSTSSPALRFVLYARKSSESEDRQVQSIEGQLAEAHAVAQADGLNIALELTENRSAKEEGKRPIFTEMLRKIKKGEINAILCWHVNRLSRNPEESGKLQGMLQRGELKMIRTPGRTYLPEDNALVFSVETSMANQDIIELRRNTGRGIREKIEKGWFPHKAPEGYKNTPHLPRGARVVERDPERFPVLRRAIDLILGGTHSANGAYELLVGEWGYTSPRYCKFREGPRTSGPLPRSTFYGLLCNPFLMGYFREGGDWMQGAHEPMLTPAEFERLQAIITKEHPGRKTRHLFAYTRLIRCAQCGYQITADVKKKASGKEYRYYYCQARGCRRYYVPEGIIDAQIGGTLTALTLEPGIIALLRTAIQAWEADNSEGQQAVRSGQEASLRTVKVRLSSLLEMKLDALLTSEEYAEKKAQLSQQERELIAALSRSALAPIQAREKASAILDFHAGALSLFREGGAVQKRHLAQGVGASYLMREGKLEMEISALLVPVRDHLRGLQAAAEPKREERASNIKISTTRVELHRTVESGSERAQSGRFVPAVRCGSTDRTKTKQIGQLAEQIIQAVLDNPGIEAPRLDTDNPPLALTA